MELDAAAELPPVAAFVPKTDEERAEDPAEPNRSAPAMVYRRVALIMK